MACLEFWPFLAAYELQVAKVQIYQFLFLLFYRSHCCFEFYWLHEDVFTVHNTGNMIGKQTEVGFTS